MRQAKVMPYTKLTEEQLKSEINWAEGVVKEEKKGGGRRMRNPSKTIASFSSNLPRHVEARPIIEFDVHTPTNKFYNEKHPNVCLRIDEALYEYLQRIQHEAKAIVHARSEQFFGKEVQMEAIEAMMSSSLKVSAFGCSLRTKMWPNEVQVVHEDGHLCDIMDLLKGTPCTVAIRVSAIWANSNQWGVSFEIKKIIIHERVTVDLDFYDGESDGRSNSDEEDDSEPEQQRKRKAPAKQRVSKKSKGLLN